MLYAITGTIGVGKSSVLELFKERAPSTNLYFEPLPEDDNFVLTSYYKEPSKYSYPMQSLMLALHNDIQRKAIAAGGISIMDSALYCGKAFADTQYELGYMNAIEHKVYQQLYTSFTSTVPYPKVIFYLTLELDLLLARIRERNRLYEACIDTDYFKRLHSNYGKLIGDLSEYTTVVRIDARLSKQEVFETVFATIKEYEYGVHRS